MEDILQSVLRNLHVVPEGNNTAWICTRFPLRNKFCELTITIDDSKLKNAQATLFEEGSEENGELSLFKREYSAVIFDDRQIICPILPP